MSGALQIELDGGENNYPEPVPSLAVVAINQDRTLRRAIPRDLLPHLPPDALRDLRGAYAYTGVQAVLTTATNGLQITLD